ncbi:MAG: ribonuclease M5 [Tissierellia bacterium]|nr:ribonuclease M5 [Tissierellia bacterium]
MQKDFSESPLKIKEIIIVEGRDDITAVKSAVDCEIIATGGTHFSKGLFAKIEKAYERKGIIIFTDPDYAGQKIRSQLNRLFPKAKNAYLPQSKAMKKDDIGIENASKDDIIDALENAKITLEEPRKEFTMEDLYEYGLIGPNSKAKRLQVGEKLQIGYGNGKQFLKRLNAYGIEREELEEALDE